MRDFTELSSRVQAALAEADTLCEEARAASALHRELADDRLKRQTDMDELRKEARIGLSGLCRLSQQVAMVLIRTERLQSCHPLPGQVIMCGPDRESSSDP
jgi:hypothetical protein